MRGCALVLTLAFCALTASAQGTPAKSALLDTQLWADIAPQDLSSAVISISKQAGVQVVMPAAKLDRYAAASLHGRMSLRDALAQLLRDTPYRFRQAGANTIVIDAVESASVTQ